jgi:hypothetical protein
MKKRLFRLTTVLTLCVSSYGIFTLPISHAQCGCSCAFVCPGTCNVGCDGCDFEGLIATARQCCYEERSRTRCEAEQY